MTDQEEKIIIDKVRAGDTHAFAVLVNAYKDMAVLLAYNIVLNQEDAEEVAQDAFVNAYASLLSFRADARFSTWLYRIVVNKALNKKKLKRYYFTEITEAIAEEHPVDIKSLQDPPITAEHRKHIQLALQTLQVNERLCMTLYYLNELAVEEIRQLTGISTSNIKVLLYRGRKNLYTALHQHLKGELTNFIQP